MVDSAIPTGGFAPAWLMPPMTRGIIPAGPRRRLLRNCEFRELAPVAVLYHSKYNSSYTIWYELSVEP
jgi:hypothetical protein